MCILLFSGDINFRNSARVLLLNHTNVTSTLLTSYVTRTKYPEQFENENRKLSCEIPHDEEKEGFIKMQFPVAERSSLRGNERFESK